MEFTLKQIWAVIALFTICMALSLVKVLILQEQITKLELELSKAEFIIESLKDVYLERNELDAL